MRPNGYELEEVDIKGEAWADRGAREVTHFDQLDTSWIAFTDIQCPW